MADGHRNRLRRDARAARAAFLSALSPQLRSGLESALARNIVPHLPQGPLVIGSYRAVADEIDPAAIARLRADATLAWPRVAGPGLPLAFHLADAQQLRPGHYGIPEPPADAPAVRPGVLLVPLLLADRAGNRLGQGGGHYDRTLASLRAAGPLLAIGLAWDVQLCDRLEPCPWDAPLDAVATPSAFHWCATGAKAAPCT